jgi:hypothetical protein
MAQRMARGGSNYRQQNTEIACIACAFWGDPRMGVHPLTAPPPIRPMTASVVRWPGARVAPSAPTFNQGLRDGETSGTCKQGPSRCKMETQGWNAMQTWLLKAQFKAATAACRCSAVCAAACCSVGPPQNAARLGQAPGGETASLPGQLSCCWQVVRVRRRWFARGCREVWPPRVVRTSRCRPRGKAASSQLPLRWRCRPGRGAGAPYALASALASGPPAGMRARPLAWPTLPSVPKPDHSYRIHPCLPRFTPPKRVYEPRWLRIRSVST